MVGVLPEPRISQVRFITAAPSESPAKEMPLTLAAGLTKFLLESKLRDPFALADATGSWITLPEVEMFAPTIESWPPTDETFTPTICAAVNAAWRSVTYWATVSRGFAVTAGAVIVAVPVAVGPVIVRFVPGFTVAVRSEERRVGKESR